MTARTLGSSSTMRMRGAPSGDGRTWIVSSGGCVGITDLFGFRWMDEFHLFELGGVQGIDEGVDDARVELGAGAAAQLDDRLGARASGAIRALGDERVVRLRHAQDAALERDLLAGEARGVTGAVPA